MIPAETIANLATLGLSAEQARAVAEMLRAVEVATQAEATSAIEGRRASDRERKARQRERDNHVKSRDVTGQDVTARDTLSPKEKSPTPPKEITPIPIDVGGEARGARDRRLEAECRLAAGELPVLTDPNFTPVLVLLDAEPSLTPADAVQAVRNVLEAQHRLRWWSRLEPWIRRAARNRLEAAMPPANYARAGPSANASSRPLNATGKPNGTPANVSDILRAKIQRRADDAERNDPKLLSG